jgi:5-methylcytosine-specific restriction protein A
MSERTCKGCGKTKPVGDFQKTGKLYKDGSPKYHGKCKICMNEYQRNYLKENPEKRKEFAKLTQEWAKANRGKLNEYHKEYEKKNRAKASEAQRKWRKKVVKKMSAYWRAYNKERRQVDPGYVKTLNEYCRSRRLHRKQVGGSHTPAEWEALKAQHNYTCLCCGRQEPEIKLTRDHIVAITKGGTDDISNIQPLCGPCNSKKQTELIDFRAIV